VVDIDLISYGKAKFFTFFVSIPGIKADYHEVDFDTLYSENEIVYLDENELRTALENLPCCTTNEDGTEKGDPLNLVLIGSREDLSAAFVRRGWLPAEQTYGKGTVQNLVPLKGFLPTSKEKLGQLKVTIAKYYRITGSSTQNLGVVPDIVLPSAVSPDEFGESSRKTALPWDQAPPPQPPGARQFPAPRTMPGDRTADPLARSPPLETSEGVAWGSNDMLPGYRPRR